MRRESMRERERITCGFCLGAHINEPQVWRSSKCRSKPLIPYLLVRCERGEREYFGTWILDVRSSAIWFSLFTILARSLLLCRVAPTWCHQVHGSICLYSSLSSPRRALLFSLSLSHILSVLDPSPFSLPGLLSHCTSELSVCTLPLLAHSLYCHYLCDSQC